MLYGIRRDLQRELVAQGFRLRLYVPYGDAWYPYFMRQAGGAPGECLVPRQEPDEELNAAGAEELEGFGRSLIVVMRYWLYLAAKLAGWYGAMYVLQTLVEELFPVPPPPLPRFGEQQPLFMHDLPFTFAIFAVWLVGAGLFALIVWDHRRRCRTCLRRLDHARRERFLGKYGHVRPPAYRVDLPIRTRHVEH